MGSLLMMIMITVCFMLIYSKFGARRHHSSDLAYMSITVTVIQTRSTHRSKFFVVLMSLAVSQRQTPINYCFYDDMKNCDTLSEQFL